MKNLFIGISVILVLFVGIGLGFVLDQDPECKTCEVCEDCNYLVECSSIDGACEKCQECKVFEAGEEKIERERDNRSSNQGSGYKNEPSECAKLHNRSLC